MNPDLFRLKLLTAVCFGASVFFLLYVLQRAWYRARTKRLAHIETIHFRGIQEGGAIVLGLALGWLGIGGVLAVKRFSRHVSLPEGVAMRDFEVAAADQSGFTLIVYPATDGSQPLAATRREGMIVSPGTSFSVRSERVEFGAPLSWLGQPDLFRVMVIAGDTPGQAPSAPLPATDESVSALRLNMAESSKRSIFDWPWVSDVTEEEPRSPGTLASRSRFHLTQASDGQLTLRPLQ